MRAIVIGGGIMGLCSALALQRTGHRVTVYEQGSIPNPMGSSVDHHRLIRHPYGPLTGYAMMINSAFKAWGRLWSQLGQTLFHATGTLVTASDDTAWVDQSLSDMNALGIRVEALSADGIRHRAPMIRADGFEKAAWIDSGGVLFAEPIVAAIARHLVLSGVTVNTNTPVVDIDPVRGSVTLADGTRARAEIVIVACGPWVRELVPSIMGRVKPSRQVVAYLEPPPHLADAWRTAPMILDIHGAGGIYAVPPVGGTGLKVGDHTFSRKGHPSRKREVKPGEAERLFEACRSRFLELDAYRIAHAKTCFYTVEADERFILEKQDRAVIVTGFSGHGFKFGALMGEIVAGLTNERLTPTEATELAAGRIADRKRIEALTSLCSD